MKTVVPDLSRVASAAQAIPADTPVALLNLLKFRGVAQYESGDSTGQISGRDAYLQRYVPAFNAVASSIESSKDVKLIFIGSVGAMIIAPDEEGWDDVAIVQYPSFAAFQAILDDEAYQRDAEPHRTAALEDMRLIAVIQQTGT